MQISKLTIPLAYDSYSLRRPFQAWTGTLSASSFGTRPDTDAPVLGLLEVEGAICTLSVYATAPPIAAGQPPRTIKLPSDVHDIIIEFGEHFIEKGGSVPVSFVVEQEELQSMEEL